MTSKAIVASKTYSQGEIPMETVFCSHFLDTVAATQDKNRFQSDFFAAAFCRDDQTWSFCIGVN